MRCKRSAAGLTRVSQACPTWSPARACAMASGAIACVFRIKSARVSDSNPPPFPMRYRHRDGPLRAWDGHRPLRPQRTLPGKRQLDAGKRPFKRAARRPGPDPYAQVATMRRRGALLRCDRGVALLWPKRGQSDLDIVFAHRRSCDAAGDLPGQLPLSTVVIQPMAPTTAIVSQQRQHLQGFPTVPR